MKRGERREKMHEERSERGGAEGYDEVVHCSCVVCSVQCVTCSNHFPYPRLRVIDALNVTTHAGEHELQRNRSRVNLRLSHSARYALMIHY